MEQISKVITVEEHFMSEKVKWGIPKALREKESYSGAKGKGQLHSAVCRERRNYRGWGETSGIYGNTWN